MVPRQAPAEVSSFSGCRSNADTVFVNVLITQYGRIKFFYNLQRSTIQRSNGIPLAQSLGMGWICQHCDAPFIDSPYRVKSEEAGVVLLDLIVCRRCYMQARELGLRTEEIKLQSFLINGDELKKA